MLGSFASHHILHRSWRGCSYRTERYPDSAGRHDAKSGILYHCMCTSASVHYPMNPVDSRILLEQSRSLLAGCWHGIDYKSDPRRPR
jgi:hypothetical protein